VRRRSFSQITRKATRIAPIIELAAQSRTRSEMTPDAGARERSFDARVERPSRNDRQEPARNGIPLLVGE
jgi:hypothetical protein